MTYRDYMIGSNISIHAPREGGDHCRKHMYHHLHISIHAPREGGDLVFHDIYLHLLYFNPRPPRGGRPGGFLYE